MSNLKRRRHYRCWPHENGVEPGTPPFFYPDCVACEEKKAAGKVTGNEGPLDKKTQIQRALWRVAGYAPR